MSRITLTECEFDCGIGDRVAVRSLIVQSNVDEKSTLYSPGLSKRNLLVRRKEKITDFEDRSRFGTFMVGPPPVRGQRETLS